MGGADGQLRRGSKERQLGLAAGASRGVCLPLPAIPAAAHLAGSAHVAPLAAGDKGTLVSGGAGLLKEGSHALCICVHLGVGIDGGNLQGGQVRGGVSAGRQEGRQANKKARKRRQQETGCQADIYQAGRQQSRVQLHVAAGVSHHFSLHKVANGQVPASGLAVAGVAGALALHGGSSRGSSGSGWRWRGKQALNNSKLSVSSSPTAPGPRSLAASPLPPPPTKGPAHL